MGSLIAARIVTTFFVTRDSLGCAKVTGFLGLVGAMLLAAPAAAMAQAAAAAPAAPPAPAAVASSSELLKPALDALPAAIDGVRLDKWKCPGSLRDEAAANISSIRGDLGTTLPKLLVAGDGAPASVVSVLPVFRNVDALYDVLLRVTQAAEMCAPKQQSAALEDALTKLEGSRRAMGDQLQLAAAAEEQNLLDTQAALRAKPVPVAAPVAVEAAHTPAPTVHAAKPRKPKPKPAVPAAAPAATTAPVQH